MPLCAPALLLGTFTVSLRLSKRFPLYARQRTLQAQCCKVLLWRCLGQELLARANVEARVNVQARLTVLQLLGIMCASQHNLLALSAYLCSRQQFGAFTLTLFLGLTASSRRQCRSTCSSAARRAHCARC